MNVAARLAGFAAVLVLVFAAPHSPAAASTSTRQATEHADHGRRWPGRCDGAAAGARPRGQRERLALQLARRTAPQGKPFELAFRILDRRGQTVRDFDVEHTKRMHFIVVRRDMTGFQHLHPTESADGTWSLPVTLPDAGTYRVFADFSVGGKPYTLADDITVDGSVRSQALPAPAGAVGVDGLRVRLTEGARRPARNRAGVHGHPGRQAGRHPATTWAPRATSSRCARATSPSCTSTPTRTACSSWPTFPTAGTLPPVPPVQDADGRLHTAAFTQEVTR